MKVSALYKYKDELYSSLSRDLEGFEKNFLLIGSGVLAFSITFIKDIVKIEDAEFFFVLFVSWTLFAAAIGLIIYTFPYSAGTSDKLSKCTTGFINEFKLTDENQELTLDQMADISSRWDNIFSPAKKSLNRMRYYAMAVFFTGIILFGVFVGSNIYIEKARKNDRSSRNGDKRTAISADSLKIYSKDSLIIIIK